MTERKRHGLVLLLVAGLIAASVVSITQFKTRLGLDLQGGVELVYQGELRGLLRSGRSPTAPFLRSRLGRAP